MELALLDFDNTLTTNEGIILNETINDIKKYVINNKICIISNSSFNELNEFKNKNNLDISFYSLSNMKGLILNEILESELNYNLINDLFLKFKDYIYTAWSNDLLNSYIYNYQERLNFLYPKEKRIIINNLEKNINYIIIAINIGIYDEFYEYLNELNLGYEIIAKDLKRNIVKIFDKNFYNDIIFKKIIKSFNSDFTIGIGDSLDNLKFIDLCDEKIAMKDSILATKIKKTTKYDNNHNGCLDYLINR